MRSYVRFSTTGGAISPPAVLPLSSPWLMASPASTYSTVISCSLLRAWLVGAVESGLRRNVSQYDDHAGQAAALVVAGGRAVPVVAGSVEVEGGPPARVVHEPDELPVAIARQECAVRVEVVVDELEVDVAAVRQHQDLRIPAQLVGVDANSGRHAAVGVLRSLTDVARAQHLAQCRLVLRVQTELAEQVGSLVRSARHRASP